MWRITAISYGGLLKQFIKIIFSANLLNKIFFIGEWRVGNGLFSLFLILSYHVAGQLLHKLQFLPNYQKRITGLDCSPQDFLSAYNYITLDLYFDIM